MKLLLDTQLYLWFLADSPRLKSATRQRIADAELVLVSAASIWEAAIKTGVGKLRVDIDELARKIESSGFAELPVSALHAAKVASLPLHHRDPFDRLLVAQALEEPARLLTADPVLRPYSELVEVV
ncbi:MAG: PIN domain-containing protein [Luteitalea sp.]|nr:PIN domain-containing protein [Luteitalea sp.]